MSGINNYFSNNNIFNGTEIPTQGKFDVGDIVVNIGENAEEEPMWMCIEAGEPGVWKVVGKVEDIDLSGITMYDIKAYADDETATVGSEIDALWSGYNELFQSANNGKELIASAIGEPLDSNDTFSAMSNDINSLLSTFKTNMMNNGITVESGDKFKSLIDKIATMVEEGEGKGIQYASEVNVSGEWISGIGVGSYYCRRDLGFKPSIIIIMGEGGTDTLYIDSVTPNGRTVYHSNAANAYSKFNDHEYVNDTGFCLWIPQSKEKCDYYAIGVGEEDTTLRDSLASILQGEGVNVTEEDDMASLISKVDGEFDRKNDSIKYKGSDIIVSTDLPQEVVDNRIVIIAENCNGLLMDNKDISEVAINEGDVYIKYGFESNITEELNSPDCPIAIHLETVYQSINGELKTVDNIYKGIDGTWVKVLDNEIYIYHDNIFKFPCDTGIKNLVVNTSYSINTSGEYKNYLNFKIGDSNGPYGLWSFLTNEKIDLTSFSKLELSYVLKCTDNSYLTDYYDPGYVGLAASTERVFYELTDTTLVKKYNSIRSFRNEVNAKKVIELDISDLNDLYYVGLVISNNNVADITASSTLIEYIKLIK